MNMPLLVLGYFLLSERWFRPPVVSILAEKHFSTIYYSDTAGANIEPPESPVGSAVRLFLTTTSPKFSKSGPLKLDIHIH